MKKKKININEELIEDALNQESDQEQLNNSNDMENNDENLFENESEDLSEEFYDQNERENLEENNESSIYDEVPYENVEKSDENQRTSLKEIWKNNFDSHSIIKKLVILLFIVFLFIFITTKIGQNSEKKVTEKNLEIIKDASYKYFKENNRPTIENEEYIVTLGELIDGNYMNPIKNKKGNLCSEKNSHVTIEKKSATKYNLSLFLDCNSKTATKEYTLTYASTPSSINSASLNETTKTYYKLKKGISTDNYQYVCPTGYVLNGKYCYGESSVLTIPATAKYKSVSAKKINANYKKEEERYEYVEPIITVSDNTYYCRGDAVLDGDECIQTKDYRIVSTCPNGTSKQNQNTCYYKEDAKQGWSDWEYISTNTYRTKKTNTDTKLYERIDSYKDGSVKKYKYKYYTREKTYSCNEKENEKESLKGSKCYYYVSTIEEKKCPAGYVINEDQSACIKKIAAKVKQGSTEYQCPEGYETSGTGKNTKCYKRTTTDGYYYCKNPDYRLEDDKCVVDASTEFVGYTCPSGYELSGNECIKVLSGEKIKATKTNDPEINVTYKWSEKDNENGWVWTGETKVI